jgi:Uma2 family endonuclease
MSMAERVTSPSAASASAPPEFVSAEEYMARYAHDFYEWVKGELIKMSPVTDVHDLLSGYLYKLLDAYLSMRPIGHIRRAPFVMQVDITSSRREPDIQVILNLNPGQLTRTAMIGPADICIEVVSLESGDSDYGKKFLEFEKAGVQEYWIIDPLRKAARLNRLTPDGIYVDIAPDGNGYYHTPLLPGLKVHVPTLWQDKLPNILQIVAAVQEMLK